MIPSLRLCVLLASAGHPGTPCQELPACLYCFDSRADELRTLLFPRRIRPTSELRPIAWRHQPPDLSTLDAVMETYREAELAAFSDPQEIDLGDDSLESFWLSMADWNRRADEFLSPVHVRRMTELASQLARSELRFRSVLEKALFQRDLHQGSALFHAAIARTDDAGLKRGGEISSRALAELWRRTWLTREEFAALRRILPAQVVDRRFRTENRFELRDCYLPRRVLSDEPEWHDLGIPVSGTDHFADYRGRSFIRIYVKTPGWDEDRFRAYWAEVYGRYGRRAHLYAKIPPMPPKTETLLVRTFGVFLDDTSYADSGFPEEVLLRAFKYQTPQLDPATSDYRGTLHYQYKMRPRSLLADPASLGLHRRDDDAPTFPGFFADIPHPEVTPFADPVTTMRYNCIACHSTVHYGASTVFSLGLSPFSTADSHDGYVLQSTTDRAGSYTLQSPEIQTWLAWIKQSEADLSGVIRHVPTK